MSNTELDTKNERECIMKALIEYLTKYLATEEERWRREEREMYPNKIPACPDEFVLKPWIAEGIEAFESIHDVEVCVFDNPLRNAPAEGEKGEQEDE